MAVLAQGTLTATGAAQDVVNSNLTKRVEGFIDLTNMQSGDTVVITYKVKVRSAGSMIRKWQATYSGAQTDPLIGFAPHLCPYGIQIILQQTAGVNRTYDYYFEKY